MFDLSPIVWMLIAGAAFVWFMARGIGPARRFAGGMAGALALNSAPDADARYLPPARNRDGAWRLTTPARIPFKMWSLTFGLFVAIVNFARTDWLIMMMLCVAALLAAALALWLLDLAVVADEKTITATRISAARGQKPLWSHRIRDLTGVEERGHEVLLTFSTGETRSLPRGLEGRKWLADDLRRRLAERTAA